MNNKEKKEWNQHIKLLFEQENWDELIEIMLGVHDMFVEGFREALNEEKNTKRIKK